MKILNGLADDKMQAERVERYFPGCSCENFSVGKGSPGQVTADEVIYRMIITPGDVNPSSGELMLHTLNDVRGNGLSVFRACASDEEISALVVDRLSRKPDKAIKTVRALLSISTATVRRLQNEVLGRLFCVYDETVPRKIDPLLPWVSTHATVLQRLYPAGTAGRNALEKEVQLQLHKQLSLNLVDIFTFRNGLIADLNTRSMAGEFQIAETAAA